MLALLSRSVARKSLIYNIKVKVRFREQRSQLVIIDFEITCQILNVDGKERLTKESQLYLRKLWSNLEHLFHLY